MNYLSVFLLLSHPLVPPLKASDVQLIYKKIFKKKKKKLKFCKKQSCRNMARRTNTEILLQEFFSGLL